MINALKKEENHSDPIYTDPIKNLPTEAGKMAEKGGTGEMAKNGPKNGKLGRTPRGSCNRTLLRTVLKRLFKGSAFLEKFWEGTL